MPSDAQQTHGKYHHISDEEEEDENAARDNDDNSIIIDHETNNPSSTRPSHLSPRETRSLLFLLLLYFVHSIPVTFSWMSMPILLRQQLSYTSVATFIISQYPTSLRIIWAPLIDGFYFPILGRRKTWLVPSFILGACVLLWLGARQDGLVKDVAEGKGGMGKLVSAWFLIMALCATVKVAVDSWALDLLTPGNVHWTSTVGNVGEAAAGLVSFTGFMGLEFLYTSSDGKGEGGGGGEEEGKEANTRPFFIGVAVVFLVTALLLVALAREREGEGGDTMNRRRRRRKEGEEGRKETTVREAYTILGKIIRLRHVWKLMLIHMASMVGFITNDTITILQLVKNHFNDLELAGLGTVTVPFATVAGVLIARALTTRHPLEVWRKLFAWRLLLAFVSQLTVLFVARYPEGSGFLRWIVVFLPYCLSRSFESAMWVTFVAFHAQISDPRYGGMYMSLLATTLNVRYDLLQFVFTKIIGAIDGGDGEEDLTQSTQLIDGYQIVNLIAVVLAIPIYRFFLKPATLYLQTLDVSVWRIRHSGASSSSGDGGSYELVARDEEN